MEYCDVCDRNVPSKCWNEHEQGWRHQQNLEEDDCGEDYCDICECCVPPGGWLTHEQGKRHQENARGDDGTESDDDDVCHETELDAESILYGQNSIKNTFEDGTTLQEGIDNVNYGMRCTVVVRYDKSTGKYVARNNRTLFCYKQCMVPIVKVVCDGVHYGPSFDSVKVRGGY